MHHALIALQLILTSYPRRRRPWHLRPGFLLACKPLCHAALSVPPTFVRVRLQQHGTAPVSTEAPAAYAGSVSMLEIECEAEEEYIEPCLRLASPQLHSLAALSPFDWEAAALLPRFMCLERLAFECQRFDGIHAAVLGALPLRQLLLDISWESSEFDQGSFEHLPAMPQLEVLRIVSSTTDFAGMAAMPTDGQWLGSGRLRSLVLRQVQLAPDPPPPVLASLEGLELGTVSRQS